MRSPETCAKYVQQTLHKTMVLKNDLSSANALTYLMLMSLVTIVLTVIADNFNYEFRGYHLYLKITLKKANNKFKRGSARGGGLPASRKLAVTKHIYINL